MTGGPALSIVITSWNTRELLGALLTSLGEHPPGLPFETIVVDNASTDGSADMVERSFPAVHLVRNANNLGYAPANNQGISRAGGEFILLLGSDTRMVDDSITRMVQFLRERPRVGAVSCRLLNPDGSPQTSCRRFPTLRDAVATYLSLHSLARRYTYDGFDFAATQEVEQPAATCLLIRRSVLDRIGLFDESLTILYNDVDLCRRIRDDGWSIFYFGDAEVIHHGSRSTRQADVRLRREMYRNILLYYRRHSGPLATMVLMPILLVRLLAATRSLSAFRLLLPESTGETG